MPSSAPIAPASSSRMAGSADTASKRLVARKQSRLRKQEAKTRAALGQAAIDRGEEPAPIDPKEAARFQALSNGVKATRQSLGFSLEDALRKAESGLAKYQPTPLANTESGSVEFVEEDDVPVVEEDHISVDDAIHTNALKTGALNPLQNSISSRDGKKKKTGKKGLCLTAITGSDQRVIGSCDCDIFEDDLEDNGEKEEGVPVDFTSKHKGKLLSHYPQSTFGTKRHIRQSPSETEERCKRFDDYVRLIIRRLKLAAMKYVQILATREFRAMTRRFVTILHNADEEWLVQQVLEGVPESTKLVLGKEDFTISDLLSLPCLANEELRQQGVYLDVVEGLGASLEQLFELYIGSASGENGISQRWHDYEPASRGKRSHAASGLHGEAINDARNTMNLRALAIYGHDPISWMTILSESIFMFFLGTVRDTGIRRTGRNSNMCSDELYAFFAEISEGLPTPRGDGLNSTLSIMQGYRTRWNSERAKCCNSECRRPMVPKKHPAYEKHRFCSYDASHPGESTVCINCIVYEKRHGGAKRPREYEQKRLFREANPRSYCMWKDCKKELRYIHFRERPKGVCPGTIVQNPSSTGEQYMWVCEPHAKNVRDMLKQTRAHDDVGSRLRTDDVPDAENHSTAVTQKGPVKQRRSHTTRPSLKAQPNDHRDTTGLQETQRPFYTIVDDVPQSFSGFTPDPPGHDFAYFARMATYLIKGPRYPWWANRFPKLNSDNYRATVDLRRGQKASSTPSTIQANQRPRCPWWGNPLYSLGKRRRYDSDAPEHDPEYSARTAIHSDQRPRCPWWGNPLYSLGKRRRYDSDAPTE